MGVDEAGVRSRGWVAVAALAAALCALVFPAIAGAETFSVDSNGDGVDASLGSGGCLTVGGKCTLRAAIEESNFSVGERDEILFDEGVFDAGPGSTIVLGASLPTVVDSMHIIGHDCSTPAGVSGPCVEIDGSSGAPAVMVKDTEEVVIEGVAVTGAEIGISVEGSSHFEAFRNWLGVKLDGSAAGNGIGILIGPGSDRSRIGPGEGNLFANNSGDGLDIHGASKARVLSNVFGIKPGTAAPAANGTDIEVTSSTEGGGVEAEGNEIGTRIEQAGVATPLCDHGCNVISGAGTDGIDLQGDGGEEAPAVGTTIAGNYIGLDPTGAAAVPNAESGIRVGEAAETVIGGPKPGDANRIDGGETGVDAGPIASDLVVRGNRIGVDGAGTGALMAPEEGIHVNSEGLLSPALEAVISDNEIRMEGGVGIAQNGFGAWISGNTITGGKTGIGTSGLTEEHGNLIEGNSIEGSGGNGILVESDLNEILGNQISLTGGAGILIQGSAPFGVSGNLVGGDTARDENLINGSGAAAIEVSNPESAENEVARNRGNANTGLFIDLLAASKSEPKGPNEGIQPPAFSAATEGGASGSGAQAGATVRVFRKQVAAPGEVESFLGEAIADAGGNWSVSYGAAIPAGTVVAASQTSEAGGTSELATASTAGGGAPGGEGGGGSGKSGSGNKIPPRTKIVTGPKARSRSRSALFRFFSDELGSTFRCSLDGEPFRPCRSPKGYGQLKPGKHLFRVRAVDPAGNIDPTPAKNRFTVE